MDITSYLLGKNSGGGDKKDFLYLDISKGTLNNTAPNIISLFTVVDIPNSGSITNMSKMFYGCPRLETIKCLDTSNTTNMSQMFYNCKVLKNIPILDTSKVTNFLQTFSLCPKLTEETLDNILVMCINATSYTGTKTLYYLLGGAAYSASKIQSLPHYQDFIDAGWTIGYE